jgi:hypothetical protein
MNEATTTLTRADTMKGLLESFGIALCGLATSILVALADVAIARMTGFDFFTFSIWVVVPVGALLTGFAAASGYYFGSLYFHKKASASLLVQMVLIAGAAQMLIYWTGYATMVLDDGRKVADFVPFAQYMDLILTKTHYRIGRGQADTGEVGSMGYWIAGAQFVGFLFGGLAVFGYLKAKPVCAACSLYLRPMAKKQKIFADADAAGGYYDRLFTLAVDGPDFEALIRSEAKVDKVAQGALQVNTSLLGCPVCKAQMVEEKVKAYNGTEWKDLNKLDRRVNIPSGIDLAPVFRG